MNKTLSAILLAVIIIIIASLYYIYVYSGYQTTTASNFSSLGNYTYNNTASNQTQQATNSTFGNLTQSSNSSVLSTANVPSSP